MSPGRSRFGLVFFDVDSTLVTIEGIDVLGEGNPEIAALTEAAMNGEIPVDEAYARRLETIRPSRQRIDDLGQRYLDSMTPGAEETIRTLREAGASVHLVTGGIAEALGPLVERLGLPARALHAVSLSFDEHGAWAGFDRTSPLWRPGGKAIVVKDVRSRNKGRAAFVGDGVTDLEASSAVDLFIGFGGVRIRQKVRLGAGAWIDRADLRELLPHLLEP